MIATDVTDALVTMLAQVRRSNDYGTDIGADVRVAAASPKADEAPLTIVNPGPEREDPGYGFGMLNRQITIVGIAQTDDHPDLQPHALVDKVIHDIRTCINAVNSLLDDLCEQVQIVKAQPGHREAGGTAVGASVEIKVIYRQACAE